jgi:hypothetical protein
MKNLIELEIAVVGGGDMACFCLLNNIEVRETLGDATASICKTVCCGPLWNQDGWSYRGPDVGVDIDSEIIFAADGTILTKSLQNSGLCR